ARLADAALAAALDHHAELRGARAEEPRRFAFLDFYHRAVEGRNHRATVERIRVAQGLRALVHRQRGEAFHRVGPGKTELRARRYFGIRPHRTHVAEYRVRGTHQRHVEDVDPGHCRLGIVLVAVPRPVGRDDEIAALHLAAHT